MKKVISLILVIFMITMLLTGCFNSSKIAELRQEVENLQSELSQVKDQISNAQSTIPDAKLPKSIDETSESETPTKTVTNDMLDYLTTLLYSNDCADWNAVASCNYATEAHLLIVVKKCAEIPADTIDNGTWAKKIATSICANPAVTSNVIKELSNSTWDEVLNIAAQSVHADEEALISIAKKCVQSSSATGEIGIATSICANPATTSNVIKELSNSTSYAVWNIVAQSTHADEMALMAIAKKCAKIPESYSDREIWAKEIATSICANPAVTNNVLKELENSDIPTVVAIGHAKMEEMK